MLMSGNVTVILSKWSLLHVGHRFKKHQLLLLGLLLVLFKLLHNLLLCPLVLFQLLFLRSVHPSN